MIKLVPHIVDIMKDKVISDWKETVRSELYISFVDHHLHAISIPAPGKGLLEEVTEKTIDSFIYTNNAVSAWYYNSFQDGVGKIEPSDAISGAIMYSYIHKAQDMYIVLKPKMLHYSRVSRIVSELDGDICSGFFEVIRNVDHTCELRIKEGKPSDKLHFIFLYDKETEKKAKELERIILHAYNKGGSSWTRD